MKSKKNFLSGRVVLVISLLTIVTTVLTVYITGINDHRSLVENSIISLTVLSLVFFLFLTVGLYLGVRLKSGTSNAFLKWLTKKRRRTDQGTMGADLPGPIDVDTGDDLAGVLLSIALWIIMAILFVLFLVMMEFVIVALAGLLYWIFMRGLRLIFRKSDECRGDLPKSVAYGLGYSVMYVGWLYGVVYLAAVFVD